MHGRAAALAACLLAAPVATATTGTTFSGPGTVREEIARQGAKATVDDLDRSGRIDRVFQLIGAGDRTWIALAPLLADGTDGADAEGLGIMLARALPRNPEAVLRVLQPGAGVIGVGRVCSIPFIETSAAWNKAYERRTEAALARILDPQLASIREECRRDLRS